MTKKSPEGTEDLSEGWAAYRRSKAHYFRAQNIYDLARSVCGQVVRARALFWSSEAEQCQRCRGMML